MQASASHLTNYSSDTTGRHTLKVTFMKDDYVGYLILETGGSEHGMDVIESAFDFLEYPEIVISGTVTYYMSSFEPMFNIELDHIYTHDRKYYYDLTAYELSNMITGVEIIDYKEELS